MRQTEHLGLLKPDEEEFFELSHQNGNMDRIDAEFEKKVDKEDGKGLSANDYTDADREKLSGIEHEANRYEHPSTPGSRHIPAGGSSGQVLRYGGASGEVVWGNVTAADIGLGSVDNTADSQKVVAGVLSGGESAVNADRPVWFSGAASNGTPTDKRAHDSSFQYNPATGTLKVKNLAVESTVAASVTKATQDGDGNDIVDTYAKRSLYGDDYVSVGREQNSTIGKNSFVFSAFNPYSSPTGASIASGDYSSVFGGRRHTASGDYSSVLGGYWNISSGDYSSVLGGYHNQTSGISSAVVGYYTRANNFSSFVSGKFNKVMTGGETGSTQVGDAFIIGNGTANQHYSNALRVTYLGEILGTKAFQSSGADYAEFIKPWEDGNPDSEDRVGYFVTIKDGLLYKANADDYIVGIVSGNPSVVGNADEDYYWRYERDEFNRIVMEDVPETIQKTDENGNLLFDEETHEPIMEETGKIIKNARMKLSDSYDPSLQENYIERKSRKEWDYVGMLGVLPVRDDGTCIPGQFCKCADGGIATLATERGFETYMVLERISENIVSVILK